VALKDTREGQSLLARLERRDEDLQRLREDMAASVMFAVLGDRELTQLIIRLESAYPHADGELRDELNRLLADVLTARARIWGEL
jgi:hypothetical protein